MIVVKIPIHKILESTLQHLVRVMFHMFPSLKRASLKDRKGVFGRVQGSIENGIWAF